jgi:HD-like signal output (HDOD) protein
VFKSESNPSVTHTDENMALLLAAASAVSPVSELSAVNRAALCKSAVVVHVQRNDVVKPEGANRWLMYLVEGTLSLYQGKDEVGTIKARSKEALQPLFQDKSEYQSVKTSAVAKVVKFGREQLDILLREQQKNAIHVIDVQVGDHDNLIFDDIQEDIKGNNLQLPSYGDTAAKILSTYKQVAGIPELADVLQSDPGLSSHIVRLANKAESASADSITSIRGAISRLGVEATQTSLEELLRANTIVPGNTAIEFRLRRFVQRVVLSAAICQVLAKNFPEMKSETAMLVALTSDIGELAIIGYANKHEAHFKDEAKLAEVIVNLRTILSGWILSSWDFPENFIDAAHTARDWYRNHNGEINYADLVTASLLIIQSEMPDGEHSSIPSADNLLLARRFQQAGIDLKSPAEIIKAATTKLVSVQALLKAS